MALTVEDGTGLANADALASLAEVDAYHQARGNSAWMDGATSEREQAIVRATQFISTAFSFKGERANQRDQAQAWPRSGVEDAEGYSVPSDAVPVEVRRAVAEVALRELASPGAMTPDYTPHDRISAESVGPISVTYDLSRIDPQGARPVLLVVGDILRGLLATAATTSTVAGEAVRG